MFENNCNINVCIPGAGADTPLVLYFSYKYIYIAFVTLVTLYGRT